MTIDPMTALRRIACGRTLSSAGTFIRMSRSEMIAIARAVCEEQNTRYTAKHAWHLTRPPKVKQRSNAKLVLVPRKPLNAVRVPMKFHRQERKAA